LVKKSKRREWTAEDVRELKQLAKAKTPAARIAGKLKRTEGATRQKALTLNVSLDSRVAKPTPPLEEGCGEKEDRAEENCCKEDGRKEEGVTFAGIKLIQVVARQPGLDLRVHLSGNDVLGVGRHP
jgi:hypothetical protein